MPVGTRRGCSESRGHAGRSGSLSSPPSEEDRCGGRGFETVAARPPHSPAAGTARAAQPPEVGESGRSSGARVVPERVQRSVREAVPESAPPRGRSRPASSSAVAMTSACALVSACGGDGIPDGTERVPDWRAAARQGLHHGEPAERDMDRRVAPSCDMTSQPEIRSGGSCAGSGHRRQLSQETVNTCGSRRTAMSKARPTGHPCPFPQEPDPRCGRRPRRRAPSLGLPRSRPATKPGGETAPEPLPATEDFTGRDPRARALSRSLQGVPPRMADSDHARLAAAPRLRCDPDNGCRPTLALARGARWAR